MIVVYIGRRGAGKTLTMVKDAYLYYLNGYKIISNMEGVEFASYMSNEEILKLDKNSKIKNAVLLLDEVQIFFDSRRSMKKENLTFSNFVQQIRKRNILMLCTTQFAGTIDKRLREHTDIVAKPKYFEKYKICRVKYIDVTSTQDEENYGIPEEKIVFYNALEIFGMYKTGEMIK